MLLAVAFVEGDPAYAGEWKGGFTVYGVTFVTGELSLRFGSTEIRASVTPDGTVESAALAVGQATGAAQSWVPVTLVRLAPQ
jgi:hypothetical protein